MADRHRRPPRAVRLPGGTDARLRRLAARRGQPVNAVIVAALDAFLADAAPEPQGPEAAPYWLCCVHCTHAAAIAGHGSRCLRCPA